MHKQHPSMGLLQHCERYRFVFHPIQLDSKTSFAQEMYQYVDNNP